MNLISRSISAITLWMIVLTCQAQTGTMPDPDQVLSDVHGDAAKIEKYRRALRNPDPNARITAFVAMARTDHPIVRQIAYEEGFASSDMNLRSMALRYSFFDRSTFTLKFLDGASPPITLAIIKPNQTNGDFTPSYTSGGAGSGKIQGLTVEFELGYCITVLELNDEDLLRGTQTCSDNVSRAVEVDIRG